MAKRSNKSKRKQRKDSGTAPPDEARSDVTPARDDPDRDAQGRFVKGNSKRWGAPGGNPIKCGGGGLKGSFSWRKLITRYAQTPAAQIPHVKKQAEKLKFPLDAETTVADVMLAWVFTHAVEGSAPVIKELFDRVDGKVPDTVQLSGDRDGPLALLMAMTDDRLEEIIGGAEAGEADDA